MDLKLSVLLAAIDKVTAPLKSIDRGASATSKALRETRQRLKELEREQANLKGFRKLKNDAQASGLAMRGAQQRVNQLRAAMAGVTGPTSKATAELAKAERQAGKLKAAHMANLRALRESRAALDAAGIKTKGLGEHERKLASDVAAATQQLDAQHRRLQQITAQQQRMGAARQARDRAQATGANLAVTGFATMATGKHVLGALSPAIEEAKAFQMQVAQLRSMGVGDAMVSDAVKFARGMDVMGSSATENLKLLKESYSVLRDMHEAEAVTPYMARMKFGIETVMASGGHGEGHGANAEAMFTDLLKVAELRGAAKNPESLKRVLDFATQAYVASGGLVKSEDLLNMIKTGGVAAKQLDDQSFFFGLLHTVQEMGGHRAGTGLATAYQNWAAGRSTRQSADELYQLGLLKPGSVQVHEKTGHLKKLLPDALVEGDLYRSNPFEYLMTRVIPKLNADGNLTDQQVVSKINALFSGRKGGDLFASLFMERANIAKHLAAAPKAYGVEGVYGEAKQLAGGQEAELLARKQDLYNELGTRLLPLYVSGLQKLVTVLKSVNAWSQRHPAMAKGMLVAAGAAGVLMTAIGGLMVATGGLIGQFALLRFLVRAGGLLGGAEGGLLSKLPMLGRMLPAIGQALRGVAIGVAGLSVPALALIAAVIAGAILIRHYWQPIRAWLDGVGEGISRTVGGAFAELRTAVAPLGPAFDIVIGCLTSVWRWFMQLLEPIQATSEQLDSARTAGVSFGYALGEVLSGVVQAITFAINLFIGLGEAIGTAAGWVVTHWEPVKTWFTEMWQTVEGAARGALEWISTKLESVRQLIERIRNFGATPATAGQVPIEWIMPGDTERARQVADLIGRTPMAGREGNGLGSSAVINNAPMGLRAAAPAAAGDTTITINAGDGDPQKIKRAVNDALDERDRQQRALRNSAYSDEH